MTFDLIRVTQVKPGSPSAQAGFHRGDQIIAVDGRLFPSLGAFAAYVGSRSPGGQAIIDYIPAGGGPEQAQRVAVTVGGAGKSAATKAEEPARTGMSTRTKIGLGAAALLGCYELGCFSRSNTSGPNR
jgi:C-terminal processing protease CtpA/Prc